MITRRKLIWGGVVVAGLSLPAFSEPILGIPGVGMIALLIILALALGALSALYQTLKDPYLYWVGRKYLKRKAQIPDEMLAGLPTYDPEKVELINYEPKPAKLRPSKAAIFHPSKSLLFSDWPTPELQIRLEDLSSLLLGMPIERSGRDAQTGEPIKFYTRHRFDFEVSSKSFFNILEVEATYPVPQPPAPAPIPYPPSWTPWQPNFNLPSFSPPHYRGVLKFLNGAVDAAYKEEFAKVDEASRERNALIEQCEARNAELKSLLEAAKAKHAHADSLQREMHAEVLNQYNRSKAEWVSAFRAEQETVRTIYQQTKRPGADGLLARLELTARLTPWPSFVSGEGNFRFDQESGILIHEHRFPDLGAAKFVKLVQLKSGWTGKPATQREIKNAVDSIYPSLCLRLASDILAVDTEQIISAVAVNGWADYVDRATGQLKHAYCASLFATREQLLNLNLSQVDPLRAFNALKGVAARTLELTPIKPILRLDTDDPRFVDAKDVLEGMSEGENLAAMKWEDFEHLCRELFERAFAGSGAEVRITQVSRDQGVDAVVFDPDPIRGGKIVIQAKRYTNAVDVSAVRDLYGSVINEGATKGILVTTSYYGRDAYSFAAGKPLTLLNGNELLGLLEQHGYKFRIDLAEARKVLGLAK